MKIYFCFTYYHTLIAMIKVMQEGQKADILLANDIPEYKELLERLKCSECFSNFYEYDAIEFSKRFIFKNKFERALVSRKIVNDSIPKLVTLNLDSLSDYSGLYVFNDMTGPAKYLIINNISYHLIEDGLDYYSYFDKYYGINKSNFTQIGLRKKLKELLGMGFCCWGQNNACIDIEVNKIEGIKIPKDKVYECPRQKMFDELSEDQKKLIYVTYAKEHKVDIRKDKKIILFTQPLAADRFVQTLEEQKTVFEKVIKEFVMAGYAVTIKPHPRDMMDYSELIKKYHCFYIDKNIPSEILNFNLDSTYEMAVSITSTAINFLKTAKEKRFLGKEFISSALKERNHQ